MSKETAARLEKSKVICNEEFKKDPPASFDQVVQRLVNDVGYDKQDARSVAFYYQHHLD